ncbi:MAG: hypothetical protein AAF609_18565 [Cyanobacteria bacterium P01_C01_bin.120]
MSKESEIQAKQALLLSTKNRAITRCWLSSTSYGQIAAATAGLMWPVGAMVAGTWGIAAMGGFAAVIAVSSIVGAQKESTGIEEDVARGDFAWADKYLTPDDLLDLKKRAIALGLVAPKKSSPAMGQNPVSQTTSTSGTSEPNHTSSVRKTIRKRPSWPDGEHLFMVGLSGGAKTTVLQGITAQIDSPVVYLTIKSDDTVPPNWLAYRLDKFAGLQLLRQLDWLLDTLETWVRQGKKHRLVIDEYVSLKDAAKSACKLINARDEDWGYLKGVADRFEGLVKTYIRAGRSDGHYLGLLSQTPNGTDNFDSAKTQQGLRVFLCASERSSEKFRFFVPWAKQMYADLITPEIETELRVISSGFWHLFADGGSLVLNQTEPPSVKTVGCKPCPTSGFTQSPEPSENVKTPLKPTLENRILSWLAKQSEAKPAWEIRNYCTDKTDKGRPDVGSVKQTLDRMEAEGFIRNVSDGITKKFALQEQVS